MCVRVVCMYVCMGERSVKCVIQQVYTWAGMVPVAECTKATYSEEIQVAGVGAML